MVGQGKKVSETPFQQKSWAWCCMPVVLAMQEA
jgi:hypothetical protein